MALALLLADLGLTELRLSRLKIRLQHGQFVLQAGNLLLLRQVVLLEFLVLLLGGLRALKRHIGLLAQRVQLFLNAVLVGC